MKPNTEITLSNGWSIGCFRGLLFRYYAVFSPPHPPPLPAYPSLCVGEFFFLSKALEVAASNNEDGQQTGDTP